MENSQARYDRYQTAKANMSQWQGLLEQAYRYALPKNNNYEQISPGQSVMNRVYDSTAIDAVNSFANNIQSVIMPAFMRWASLEAQENIREDIKDAVNEKLEKVNETLFKYLRQSNLTLVVNEAFQELAISTGVIFVQEGTQEEPLIFDSVSTSAITLEADAHGNIENFWRSWDVEARKIQILWPKAILSETLQNIIRTSPNSKVNLVEGFIKYHDEEESKQNFYYVQLDNDKTDIYSEFMDDSPLVAFRFSKRAGEVLGRGPVLKALPFIKVLNKHVEFSLKADALIAYPPYMANSDGVIDPFTLRIEPGSIVPVLNIGNGNFPIKQIESTGNLQYSMEKIQSLQVQIRNMLFANPLPALVNQATKSATEISLLQQNWMRENASAFGRLIAELLNPITRKCVNILYKKGLLQDIEVNGKRIDLRKLNIKYKSPIAELQEQQDLSRMQTFVQTMVSTYSEAGVLAVNADYYNYVAEKLDINKDLLNPDFSEVVQSIQSKISGAVGQSPGEVAQLANPAPVDTQQQALDAINQFLPQPGQSQS